jgi:hypothetical protein
MVLGQSLNLSAPKSLIIGTAERGELGRTSIRTRICRLAVSLLCEIMLGWPFPRSLRKGGGLAKLSRLSWRVRLEVGR